MLTTFASTKLDIVFITEVYGNNYVVESFSDEGNGEQPLSGSIRGMSTHKAKGDPAGRWSMIVADAPITMKLLNKNLKSPAVISEKRDMRWSDAIKAMTRIKISINGVRHMNGFVTGIMKRESMGNGLPEVAWEISGVDDGGLLTMHKLFYELMSPEISLELFGLSPSLGMLTDANFNMHPTTLNESISYVFNNIIAAYFKKANMVFDDDISLENKLSPFISNKNNYNYAMNLNIIEYTGEFWNLLTMLCNQPFNEIFVDCASRTRLMDEDGMESSAINPDKTYIYVRPTPFDDNIKENNIILNVDGLTNAANPTLNYNINHTKDAARKYSLKMGNTINAVDVISFNIGASISDAVNYYFVYPSQSGQSSDAWKALGNYFIDYRSVRRFGCKPLNVTLNAIDFQPNLSTISNTPRKDKRIEIEKGIYAIARNGLNKLVSWYRNNPDYKSGSVTISGRDIRICEYVLLDGVDRFADGWYYVETVQHNFQYPGAWTTVLGLTRGEAA